MRALKTYINSKGLVNLIFKQHIILYLFFLPCIGIAQFQDDFSDGDFTVQPTWEGDTAKFIINSEQELQLNDAEINSPAGLYSRVNIADSTTWEFYFKQDFKPSSNNFARVYLSSDSDDLSSELNGYYLKLGGISGDSDALELYRQTGSEHLLLASGTAGALGQTGNEARLRITRDQAGNWSIFADYEGGTNFQLEASATDNRHPSGSIFGLACKYSSTRRAHFFFDDFHISPLFEDTVGPELLEVKILDAQHIQLAFSEPIATVSAINPENYIVTPALDIATITTNSSSVNLELATPLVSNTTYNIQITALADLHENISFNLNTSFTYIEFGEVTIGDLIINELFIDPSPSIALPEAEFIELYNRSDKNLNLENFILADVTNDVILPYYVLPPNTYLLVQKLGNADFSAFGNTLAVDGFLSLGNQQDEISLIAPTGEQLDIVAYDSDWYQDADKASGGWTLERINPAAVCTRSSANWMASTDLRGGTPAQQNSVYEAEEDATFSDIQGAFLVEADRLRVIFEEALDENSANTLENYQIEGLQIIDAILEMPLQTSVLLSFDSPAEVGQTYTLRIKNTLLDCLGNSANQSIQTVFARPLQAAANDLVINEILFNPKSGGADFVEIYNRSDKILDIQPLFLANRINGVLENIKPLGLEQVLFPNDYLVLTPEPQDILKCYEVLSPNKLLANELPPLPNDRGNIVLYRLENGIPLIIDEFDYTDDMHSAIVDEEEGVSLERIHPDSPTQMSSSWHSAASTLGFATPTYQNSQFLDPQLEAADSGFSLPENTFSPNGDGYQDFLSVHYQLEQIGTITTVRIFNDQGRLIRKLAQNELLPSQGILVWDGSTDNGGLASIGIYIIHIEYFTINGERAMYQTTCVLAGALD